MLASVVLGEQPEAEIVHIFELVISISTQEKDRVSIIGQHGGKGNTSEDRKSRQRQRHYLEAAFVKVRNIKLEQSVGKVHVEGLVKKVVEQEESPA